MNNYGIGMIFAILVILAAGYLLGRFHDVIHNWIVNRAINKSCNRVIELCKKLERDSKDEE